MSFLLVFKKLRAILIGYDGMVATVALILVLVLIVQQLRNHVFINGTRYGEIFVSGRL